MKTQTNFRDYSPDQLLLLPPDIHEWLPEGHIVYFIREVVGQLDLKKIYKSYNGSKGGQPPYHPEMMVALLVYAYCTGIPSSHKIEQFSYESIAFRVLTADQHPDHDTIASFRRRHLDALAELFVQVLRLCRKAGLVKLGHVSLDGTKIRANASKHKAMSYDRMEKSVAQLKAEVKELLAKAQSTDQDEDARWGKDECGDELPEELRFKQSRLLRIKQAKEALEREARKQAEDEKRNNSDDNPTIQHGRSPKEPSEKPHPKAQRNFTDPDSRIMKDGASKSFEQCYNGQIAVDGGRHQIIVAAQITQHANDKQQLRPLIEQIEGNLDGAKPKKVSADSGYYSEDNVKYLAAGQMDVYIATGRIKHGEGISQAPRGRIPKQAGTKDRMVRKLRTIRGRNTYKKRKGIVEPVFGQIKHVRGFRQVSLRGFERVCAEWKIICLGHNILKLFKSGWCPQMA
jgi:transposase